MNALKLDPTLSQRLLEPAGLAEGPLEVTVRTRGPLAPDQQHRLAILGGRNVLPGRQVFTARLTPKAVAELSEEPWVFRLSLARQLQPLAATGG